jgi:predicted metal-dependent phosphoesterase TrpH
VEVLAITCHEANVYTPRLGAYAADRGVLLVPGIEKFVERRHVLILNPDPAHVNAHTFEELRRVGRRGAAFIAPHPYYPTPSCLRGELERNIDLFDGIEWCTLYFRAMNPNRRAARVAAKHGLPLVGTSDTHRLPYEDTTFSWIEAEPTIEGVVEAVRAGRIQLETRPKSVWAAVRMTGSAMAGMLGHFVREMRGEFVTP